jgi:predicted transcriptional regulator
MLPQARNVMKQVPPITESAKVIDVLRVLKEHSVAVLVDDGGRPFDILTSCDIERVRTQVTARRLSGTSPAKSLFTEQGREIYTVKDGDSLEVVAQRIAQRGLGTGITVVDPSGRYVGYVFNADLRDSASQYTRQVEADVRRVEAQYPEAWSSLQRRLSSS